MRRVAEFFRRLFVGQNTSQLVAYDSDDAPVTAPAVVTLSPRAIEMRDAVKHARAAREAEREETKKIQGPLVGSKEWRIQQRKKA